MPKEPKKTTTRKAAGTRAAGTRTAATTRSRATKPAPVTHEEIARRAYELHLEGFGDELANWLRAERDLAAV
jgi:hypothetical protein